MYAVLRTNGESEKTPKSKTLVIMERLASPIFYMVCTLFALAMTVASFYLGFGKSRETSNVVVGLYLPKMSDVTSNSLRKVIDIRNILDANLLYVVAIPCFLSACFMGYYLVKQIQTLEDKSFAPRVWQIALSDIFRYFIVGTVVGLSDLYVLFLFSMLAITRGYFVRVRETLFVKTQPGLLMEDPFVFSVIPTVLIWSVVLSQIIRASHSLSISVYSTVAFNAAIDLMTTVFQAIVLLTNRLGTHKQTALAYNGVMNALVTISYVGTAGNIIGMSLD